MQTPGLVTAAHVGHLGLVKILLEAGAPRLAASSRKCRAERSCMGEGNEIGMKLRKRSRSSVSGMMDLMGCIRFIS